MAVLFSDLEPAQASEIVGRLEADGIPYEAAGGGRTLRVPKDQVDRLRLVLAGEGVTGSVIGKEIFDQDNSFGRTNFELNVNYTRAIEGELVRTITNINTVRSARVHISLPERRPFQREASQASASILIQTKGGGLSPEQVRSIQALVASAIPGLTSDKVTITDTNGTLLSDGTTTKKFGSFSSIEEARVHQEEALRGKIENLIARSVGPGNVRAEVALQMNISRQTTNETRFDPDGQVVRGSELVEENTNEKEAGGQVTVADNLPDADPAATGEGASNSTSRTREVSEFDNSRVETVTITEPGAITKLSVSVMINERPIFNEEGQITGYEARSVDEIENFRTLVRAAVPYDEDRDGTDAISVVSMRFVDRPQIEQSIKAFDFFGLNKQDLVELVQLVGLILSAVLVLVLVVRPIVTRIVEAIPEAPPAPDPAQIEAQKLAAQQEAQALLSAENATTITPELLAQAADGSETAQAKLVELKAAGQYQPERLPTDARIDVARVEGRVQDSALKKVAEIIKSNPTDSVAIVRSWMYAE